MEDTAQPIQAAETDPMADAAQLFKTAFAQPEIPERPRDEQGRFAPKEQEIEAEAEGEPEAEAESHEEPQPEEEAAEEAQPEAAVLPESWSQDKAELWDTLEPDAQAYIRQRDAEQKAAVNAKFMESANLKKAYEAGIGEAQANRAKAIEALDVAIQLYQPQPPPISMLDINSSDYDPDQYHLLKAQAEQQVGMVEYLKAQRADQLAQAQTDDAKAQAQADAEINRTMGPAFVAAYPEVGDPAKAETFFADLIRSTIEAGVPAEAFRSQPNAVEWHIMADAKKWREHKTALDKVKQGQKPEPRKAQPAVRPGVTTPKSAVDASRRKKDFDRLVQTGSIEAGAAVFKSLLK